MSDSAPFGTYAPSRAARWVIDRTRALPNTWLGRRLHTMLRHVGIRLLDGVPIDAERLGVRMRLYPYTNICDKKVLFAPQFFDPEERAILAGRIGDGFTFVDVGANIGAYALFLANAAGPNARILAVEPLPAIFDRLVYNIRQNPFGTIKAVACAVADKPGELTLFLDARNSGGSSVKVVGSSQAETVRVPATTLLQLVTQERFSRLDAVKLDVEGAEDIVLEPFFRDAPAALYPSLIILKRGAGQWQIDLGKLLRERGYRRILKTRFNLVFERVPQGAADDERPGVEPGPAALA
jgi:FkbM family methyltransferase